MFMRISMKKLGFLVTMGLAACGGGQTTPAPDAPLGGPDATLAADAAPPVDAAAPTIDAAPVTGNILEDLRAVPGMVEVTEGSTTIQGYRFFRLVYEQPVDHLQPDGARFTQRIMLMHRGYDRVTVLATNGYFVPTSDGRFEPTQLLAGNQVSVEHRYFVPSRPVPTDWSKLDIWQAATDHHRIVTALRHIYPGPWINTGGSKSGMAAVYHHRFYPDDVIGTVAYVAPLSLDDGDARYIDFVENAGPSADCRQRLRDFQRAVLTNRDAMKTRMASESGASFAKLGMDKALEHATLELPFAMWQYSSASTCTRIPAPDATAGTIYAFLDEIADVRAYSDQEVERYGPYYYQAAHQLGFPAINEEHVADLLLHPGTDTAAAYLPAGTSVTYDPEVMQDIDQWVRTEGRGLLFIYGEYDPWTAAAFELGDAQDSLKLIVPAGNHSSSVRQLTEADQDRAEQLVEGWLADALGKRPFRFDESYDDPTLREPRSRF
jgi:hypothetical protein